MKGDALSKGQLRVLNYLSPGEAVTEAAAGNSQIIVKRSGCAAIAAARDDIEALERLGLVRRKSDRAIGLLAKARAVLDRIEGSNARFRAQHRDLERKDMLNAQGGWTNVLVNHEESPLAGLARRRTSKGEPFLSAAEFEAGERLRADYHKGRFMARTGVNWQAAGLGASKRRTGNVQEDLTEMALAARLRVDKAIDAVGPELAGVLIDICCFLKGMERVERERGWPVRSAKIVLKSALAALARHYNPQRAGSGPDGKRPILHWGGEGYRPSL